MKRRDRVDQTRSTEGPASDRCPDLWWTGRREVDGKTIHDPLTIRDQNGVLVRTCSTAKAARDLVRSNNRAEIRRTRT